MTGRTRSERQPRSERETVAKQDGLLVIAVVRPFKWPCPHKHAYSDKNEYRRRCSHCALALTHADQPWRMWITTTDR